MSEPLPSIFAFIGHEYDRATIDTISRPAQTTRETSPAESEQDKISDWEKKSNPSQIDNIPCVVERFGLDN